MSSSYPSGFDALTNPAATDPLTSPAHANQHSNANDAIEAIEVTLGLNPQGTVASVGARFVTVEAFIPTMGSAVAAASLSAAQSATSASAAIVYSGSANTSYLATAALYDSFDDRYLGAKSAAPTVDNDGNTLLVGALYFNTVYNTMFVWTGAAWVDASMSTYSWTGPVAIVASSTSPALKITQTGSGDVLRVEDEASDVSPFVIDTNGNLSTSGSVSIANGFTAVAGTVTGGMVAGSFTTAGTATAARFSGHGVVTLCTSSTRPGSPSSGDLIFETDTALYYGWSGSAWAAIGGGGGSNISDIFFLMGA